MDSGPLLFEYSPPRAHPIVYAGLMLFGVVWITGSIENALRDSNPAVYLSYGIPFVATLLFFVVFAPNPTRIHQNGIAPSRPLLLRWHRPFAAWDDLAAVYPSFYDVTGAFVSPFASSDGKVTQMGLGLEWPDGRRETVKFTPTRFQMWQSESAGYKGALDAVRTAFDGRPLTPEAQTYTAEEADAMVTDASKPFLPFFAIVLLFASAAPVLWILTRAGLGIGWSLAIALIAPLAVSTRSYIQSRRRNAILDALSKAAEYQRGAA